MTLKQKLTIKELEEIIKRKNNKLLEIRNKLELLNREITQAKKKDGVGHD